MQSRARHNDIDCVDLHFAVLNTFSNAEDGGEACPKTTIVMIFTFSLCIRYNNAENGDEQSTEMTIAMIHSLFSSTRQFDVAMTILNGPSQSNLRRAQLKDIKALETSPPFASGGQPSP